MPAILISCLHAEQCLLIVHLGPCLGNFESLHTPLHVLHGLDISHNDAGELFE